MNEKEKAIVHPNSAVGCGPKKDVTCCYYNSDCFKESKIVNGKLIYTGRCCNPM